MVTPQSTVKGKGYWGPVEGLELMLNLSNASSAFVNSPLNFRRVQVTLCIRSHFWPRHLLTTHSANLWLTHPNVNMHEVATWLRPLGPCCLPHQLPPHRQSAPLPLLILCRRRLCSRVAAGAGWQSGRKAGCTPSAPASQVCAADCAPIQQCIGLRWSLLLCKA